jgi:hypothetical protein
MEPLGLFSRKGKRWRSRMTLLLPLVIDIVDLVDEAQERDQNVDVEADAERLLQAHPEADKNKAEIAAMLRQQQKMVGLSTRGKATCR